MQHSSWDGQKKAIGIVRLMVGSRQAGLEYILVLLDKFLDLLVGRMFFFFFSPLCFTNLTSSLQVPQDDWSGFSPVGKDDEIPCRRMRSGSYIKAMAEEDSGDSDCSPKPSPKVQARRASYLKATQPSLTEMTTLKWVYAINDLVIFGRAAFCFHSKMHWDAILKGGDRQHEKLAIFLEPAKHHLVNFSTEFGLSQVVRTEYQPNFKHPSSQWNRRHLLVHLFSGLAKSWIHSLCFDKLCHLWGTILKPLLFECITF